MVIALILLILFSIGFALAYITKLYIVSGMILFVVGAMFLFGAKEFADEIPCSSGKRKTAFKRAVASSMGFGAFFIIGGFALISFM